MVTCVQCAQENVEGARFCNGCGASLGVRAAEVRKTVTVVFCDLVGSTALGERTDPEVLRGVMGRYHATLRRILELHGGTVEKFVGDAAMAVFGIPHVHEDDAVRAVRAAVAMSAAVAGLGLQVRIGVNTGEIVAGVGETLVTGDAVNVAARLEQVAGDGEILIGEQTERLVRGEVLVEPVDPLVLKGKSHPVPAFRVVDLSTPKRHGAVSASPFVGRDHELAVLRDALRVAADKRVPQMLTIVGPPGIGKSRLVAELVFGSNAQTLVGHCLSYGDAITYWPLVEILERLGDVDETLGTGDDAALVSVRLAAAVGAPGAAASPDEIAWAFRRLVESVARDRTLVLVFDDIHWAEPALLDLVEYVAAFTQDVPLLLLCTARPDLFDVRPQWATPRPNASVVRLEPLELSHADLLVNQLGELPDRVRAQIVDAADGNPLFVEQLVTMHKESPDRELEVPPNLQALLAARIDLLDAEERRVVECASVEGRLFHRGAVVELLPEHDRHDVGTRLLGLVRRELIRPDRPTLAGDDAFRFGHILIRDAAYESMPKRVRADLHEKYADWLEGRLGGDAVPEIVGYHLAQACTYRRDLDVAVDALEVRACHALGAAARAARLRDDVAAAAKLYERALATATRPALQAWPMLCLGQVRRLLGDFGGAAEAVDAAAQLADAISARDIRTVARLERARLRLLLEEDDATDAMVAEAREVIEDAEPDEHLVLAHAWALVALAANITGAHAQILPAVEAATANARAGGDELLEIEVAGWMGAALVFGPTPVDEGIAKMTDTMARLGHVPYMQGLALHVLGHLRARCGDFDGAEYAVRTWRDHMRELGHELGYADTATCAWDIYALVGDYAAGERELQEAAAIIDRMHVSILRAENVACQAEAAYLLGRLEDAERLALMTAEAASNDRTAGPVWRSVLAKVRAVQGAHEEALDLARRSTQLADATDMPDLRAGCRLGLAEVLRAGGDVTGARTAADEAARLYREKGNQVGAARAHELAMSLQPG
jgi:class 3 adenylate cyclase/tetratricopeptide (TPR) repeat protein